MSQPLDIASLRVFVEVAGTGNLTVAATTLGLSQSALSKRIAGLEVSLGGRLFARTGRGVQLTEFGREALPRVTTLLQDIAAFQEMGRIRGQVPTGDVRIGIAPPMAQLVVPRFYEAVAARFPEVRLAISSSFTNVLRESLLRGDLDIAVLNRFWRGGAESESLLGTYDTHLVGPADSRFLREPEIRFAQLANVPLILPGGGNEMRRAIDSIAKRTGVQLNVTMAVDSLPIMLDLVLRSRCHTLLMLRTAQDQISSGAARASRLVSPSLKRRVVLASSTYQPPSVAVRSIATLLKRIFVEVMG